MRGGKSTADRLTKSSPLASPFVDHAGPHPPLLRKQKTGAGREPRSRGDVEAEPGFVDWATAGLRPLHPRQVGASRAAAPPLLRRNGKS
jgi:hypothetical protein